MVKRVANVNNRDDGEFNEFIKFNEFNEFIKFSEFKLTPHHGGEFVLAHSLYIDVVQGQLRSLLH